MSQTMPNSTGRRFVAAENMWSSFGQKGNINILNSTWTPTPAHLLDHWQSLVMAQHKRGGGMTIGCYEKVNKEWPLLEQMLVLYTLFWNSDGASTWYGAQGFWENWNKKWFLHNVPSNSILAEFCDMLYKIMYTWNETEEYICFNNVEVSWCLTWIIDFLVSYLLLNSSSFKHWNYLKCAFGGRVCNYFESFPFLNCWHLLCASERKNRGCSFLVLSVDFLRKLCLALSLSL